MQILDTTWLRVMESIFICCTLRLYAQLLTIMKMFVAVLESAKASLPKSFTFIPLSSSSTSSPFFLWSALASTSRNKVMLWRPTVSRARQTKHTHTRALYELLIWPLTAVCAAGSASILCSLCLQKWLLDRPFSLTANKRHLSFNGKCDKRKCHSLLPILLLLYL